MIVSFSFSGTVASLSNASSGIQVGDSISGSVVYDQTQFGSNGLYTFTGSGKAHTWNFTVTRAGVQVFADSFVGGVNGVYTIRVVYNTTVGGVSGTTLEVKGPGTSTHTTLDLVMFDAWNVGMTSSQLLPTQAIIVNFTANSIGV